MNDRDNLLKALYDAGEEAVQNYDPNTAMRLRAIADLVSEGDLLDQINEHINDLLVDAVLGRKGVLG